MQTKKIKNKDLPHADHVDFLEDIEKMALKAFDFVMSRAITELTIRVRIKSKSLSRLRKADEIKPGWTGKVPKIELNFNQIFEESIAKYMDALKWILMGDAAGRKAREAATMLKLQDKIVPGVIPAAYLNSLDTHRQYYKDLFGTEAPEIQKKLINESLDVIKTRVDKFLDQSLMKMKNNMIESADMVVRQTNDANLAAVQSHVHDLLEQGLSSRRAVKESVVGFASETPSTPQISQALREAVEKYRDEFSIVVNTDVGIASAVGAHQCISEVFGGKEREPRVAIYSFRDEKTCTFCQDAARRPDGSFKLYKMSEFQPAGYNFSRKRKDWELCVPPSHFRCRCELIYVPDGFDIDNQGSIVPSKTV